MGPTSTQHLQTIHHVDQTSHYAYLSKEPVQPAPEQPGRLNRYATSVWNYIKANPGKSFCGALVVAGACVASSGAIPAVAALVAASTLLISGVTAAMAGVFGLVFIHIGEPDVKPDTPPLPDEHVYAEIMGHEKADIELNPPKSNGDGISVPDPRAVGAVVNLAAGLSGIGGGGGGGGDLGGCALM